MAKITTLEGIRIRDIINVDDDGNVIGYKDLGDAGITGYGGKLNIRPAYQREYIYEPAQRNAVINTITKFGALALGVFWWAKNEDGTFELMDGQQRTISTCQYVNGEFILDGFYFHNLTSDQRKAFLDQPLDLRVFEGTESEKLDWFKTINIAGVKLSDQELRNAAYTGPWLEDAKRKFSKRGCPAFNLGTKYVAGDTIRQEVLETALTWISTGNIEQYMADHQHDKDANELWDYFTKVIAWVKKTFKVYRKEMRGVEWGLLYNKYKDLTLDSDAIELTVSKLMADDDVTKAKGIYEFIFDGDETHLNLRAFDDRQKRIAFEKQHGYCPRCHKLHLPGAGHKFTSPSEMQGDHMISHKHGGSSTQNNLVMLCPNCNNDKSGQDEVYTDEDIAEMIKCYEGEN